MRRKWRHPETIVLHSGYRSDDAVHAVSVPIYQTTAYEFQSTRQAERIFSLDEDGNTYSRLMNPTCEVLEARMAALEDGAAALAVSSGQAAVALAVLNLCSEGDNLVSSTALYGGTWNLLANTLARMGIETRFVDPREPESFRRASDDRTRCYFAETLPNPQLEVFPIEEVATLGREQGIPLILDNTAAPILCRPLEHGAAVVVYSTTKYVGGHGSSLGGMVIDGGRFDWVEDSDRFPLFSEPDPAHGGVIWSEAVNHLETALGESSYVLKARMTLLRDLGTCLSPFNAYLLLQGLETLPLRMPAHCANAAAVARHLAGHPKVERVIYPGLMEGEARRRADAYLDGGFGPMVQFEVKGGRESGRKFLESLELFYHTANIGDARSLAIHPATTTHAQLTDEDRLAAGVAPGSVRLAVGLEHVDDLIADLDQALGRV